MDFSLSKQEQLFLQMIREFAEKEVKPLAAEVDESERFPMETVQKMAKLGIMGIPFPVELGGAGGSNILYTMAVEELSRVCATTGVIVSAHTSLCCADASVPAFGSVKPNAQSIRRKLISEDIWLFVQGFRVP